MRALIIGGTGNISGAVTAELLAMNWEVTLLNRGSASVPGTREIRCDRRDASALAAAMAQEQPFDCVFDMICYHPDEARALVAAIPGKTAQLVFVSTVDVFRKPAARYPIVEGAEIGADPAFEYAAHKVLCEAIVGEAAASGKFALTIVRPAATYRDESTPIAFVGSGENQLWRLREGKPVIVLGDGTGLWTYSHRDDVGSAIARAAANARAYGGAYTLSGDEAMTWRQHFEETAKALGAPPPELVCIPASFLCALEPERCSWSRLNFMYGNIFDNGRAKRDLGYVQTICWAEGVRRMVRHQEERGGIERDATDEWVEAVLDSWRFGERAALDRYAMR